MRRLAKPIQLGLLAFTSYSVKTNYQSPSATETSATQDTIPRSTSAEKAKRSQLKSPNSRPDTCAETDDDWLQCTADTFFGVRSGYSTGLELENKDQVRFVIATFRIRFTPTWPCRLIVSLKQSVRAPRRLVTYSIMRCFHGPPLGRFPKASRRARKRPTRLALHDRNGRKRLGF